MVIINRGKIVADDHTENLKNWAGGDHFIYLSLLKAAFPEVDRELTEINGITAIKHLDETKGDMLRLRLTCKATTDIRENIYQTIKKSNWILMEFYRKTQNLETIFRELTKEN